MGMSFEDDDTFKVKFKDSMISADNIDDLIDYLQEKAHKLWEQDKDGNISVINIKYVLQEIISILEESVTKGKL